MNLAVLLYSKVQDKPSYIMPEWPAEIKELGEGTEVPSNDWQLMTLEEYNTYVSQYQQQQTASTAFYLSKANKSNEIDAACELSLITSTRVMTSLGIPIFMCKQSLSDFQNLYLVLTSGMMDSMPYMDADGNSQTWTAAIVKQFITEMLAQGMLFYGKKAQLKQALAQATTLEAVQAINW